eukprot:2072206-Prymnesium_polylepis.1
MERPTDDTDVMRQHEHEYMWAADVSTPRCLPAPSEESASRSSRSTSSDTLPIHRAALGLSVLPCE